MAPLSMQEWQEGALFRNKLQNVLDRGRWSWDRRHQDFELYKQPPAFLELPPIPKQKPVEGEQCPQCPQCCLMPGLLGTEGVAATMPTHPRAPGT